MPEEVGVAYVRLRPSATGFAEEARSEVGTAVRGAREEATVPIRASVNKSQAEQTIKRDMGSAVRSTIGYIGGIFAAEKVFEFGKASIDDAALVQKAQETIRQEYGKSGEELERFAHGQATTFGISAVESETVSAKLGALFRNLGYGTEQSSKFTLSLQKTVGALSQIKGVDPTSVLDRLNTTMATGSTRGLRDLGIALDATTVKAEAMRLHLIPMTVDHVKVAAAADAQKQAEIALTQAQDKYGKNSEQAHQATIKLAEAHQSLKGAIQGTAGPLTVAQKDQAILSLITQHMGQNMKEAAAHQGDAANQMKVLSAEVDNAKAAIGEALLPRVTELIHAMTEAAGWVEKNKGLVVGIAEAIGVAVGAYTAWKAAVFTGNLVMDIARGAWKLLTLDITFSKAAQEEATVATEAQTVATEELNTAMYLNPAGIVAAAVVALAVGLYELYEHSATARRIMNALWSDMKHFGMEALGWLIHTGFPDVRDALTGFVNFFERQWNRWGDDVKAVVRFAWRYVETQVRDAYNIVRDVINLFGDIIHGRWGAIWDDAKQIVRDVVHAINDRFAGLPGDVLRILQRVGHWIVQEGGALVHEALQLGKHLLQGVVSGIESAPKAVGNAIKGAVGGALSDVGSAFHIGSPSRVFADRVGKPISDGIVLGTQPLHDDLRDQMVQQLTNLQNVWGPNWHDQFHDNVGRPISAGTVAGTSNLQANLGSAITDAAHGAIAHAKSALGIHSPSSVFADQVGRPIADGIVHGMGGLEHALAQKITSAAQSAMASVGGVGGLMGGPTGTAAVGANQRLGFHMMMAAGWPASQWGALQALWTRESGWNQFARNPSSGAFGIPQELGHAVSSAYLAGDVAAQIQWGLDYIRGRYGSPGAAWAHETAYGWYGGGGVVPGYPGQAQPAVVHGGEVVFTPEQINMLARRGITIQHLEVSAPSAGEFVSELDAIARGL